MLRRSFLVQATLVTAATWLAALGVRAAVDQVRRRFFPTRLPVRHVAWITSLESGEDAVDFLDLDAITRAHGTEIAIAWLDGLDPETAPAAALPAALDAAYVAGATRRVGNGYVLADLELGLFVLQDDVRRGRIQAS